MMIVVLAGDAGLAYMADRARLREEARAEAEQIQRVRMTYGAFRGLKVNAVVADLLNTRREDVLRFYDSYTQDREISHLLTAFALAYDIPVHYFVALAWAESRFRPGAINGHKNQNGTTDYGLLQLNSAEFPDDTPEFLMDLGHNIRIGADHLDAFYRRYGDWTEALISYNAGTGTSVARSSVRHVADILEYSYGLDEAFVERFLREE